MNKVTLSCGTLAVNDVTVPVPACLTVVDGVALFPTSRRSFVVVSADLIAPLEINGTEYEGGMGVLVNEPITSPIEVFSLAPPRYRLSETVRPSPYKITTVEDPLAEDHPPMLRTDLRPAKIPLFVSDF